MKKRKRLKSKSQPVPVKLIVEEKKGLSKLFSKISPVWKIVGGISLLLGLFFTVIQLWDRLSPTQNKETIKEKYEKENFDTGTLTGPRIITFKNYIPERYSIVNNNLIVDTFPEIKGILVKDISKDGLTINFGLSSVDFPASLCYEGVDVFSISLIKYLTCELPKLFIGVKGDRLYASVKFNDLQTGQNIGIIEFNHWRLFLPNLLSYNYDDERLEVKDKQGNIVFSIKYEESKNGEKPSISLKGYLFTLNSITVFTDGSQMSCISTDDKDWKKRALESMNNIKSIF